VTVAGDSALPRPARINRVEVTTASEVGATHRHRHLDADDAVGWTGAIGNSVIATVALADGHSDPRCVRSRDGAAFLVAAAKSLPDDVIGAGAITDALLADWRRRVDQHLADHPLADRESTATTTDRLTYGTTAIVCRVTHQSITIVRVGDGDVIAVTPDGRARRLAPSDQPPGDVTQSLSQPDAAQVARCAEIPADAAPVLLVLATDGFDNAYPSSDSMLRAADELTTLRRESGAPLTTDVLTQWARSAAEISGDDATVAAIWIETVR
jgi:serine/threonine protein phosphatase PrpC